MSFQPPGIDPAQNQGWAPVGQPAGPGMPPPPPGVPPMGYPPAGPPPKSSATKWIIGGIIGFVVLALVAAVAVVAVVMSSSKSDSGQAGDVVESYLKALAAGDAKKALSYGASQPGSTALLTDEVLKKQVAKVPITDIRILSDRSSTRASIGMVNASVKFGDTVSDETLFLKKVDGRWKLDNATVRIKLFGSGEATKFVKVLGQEVGPNDTVYVFPGWMGLEPLNENFTVDSSKITTLKDLGGYSSLSYSSFNLKVSEAGYAAADRAIRETIAKCLQSKDPAPADCPNRIRTEEAAPGSVTWKVPALPASFGEPIFREYRMQMNYYGSSRVEFPYTVQTAAGPRDGTASAYLSMTLDMSTSPPTVNFR